MDAGGPGQGSWEPYRPAPSQVPFGHVSHSIPAQEMLLLAAALAALLQLLHGGRAVLCFSPACSTPFPGFRRDCCFPSSNSKTKTIFPSCPVFQVRCVELLSWIPEGAEGTAHTVFSSSSPLLNSTCPAVAKVFLPCAPHTGKTLSASRRVPVQIS